MWILIGYFCFLSIILLIISLVAPELFRNKDGKRFSFIFHPVALATVFVISVIVAFIDPFGSEAKPKYPLAKEYSIVSTSDFSFPGRERKAFCVLSDQAQSKDERVQTVLKAAEELSAKYNLDTTSVHLGLAPNLIYNGYDVAIANYAPDGKGNGASEWTWDVDVSGQSFTKEQIAITSAWEEFKPQFKKADGLTDDKALKKFLAKKFALPEKEIFAMWMGVVTEKYNVAD